MNEYSIETFGLAGYNEQVGVSLSTGSRRNRVISKIFSSNSWQFRIVAVVVCFFPGRAEIRPPHQLITHTYLYRVDDVTVIKQFQEKSNKMLVVDTHKLSTTTTFPVFMCVAMETSRVPDFFENKKPLSTSHNVVWCFIFAKMQRISAEWIWHQSTNQAWTRGLLTFFSSYIGIRECCRPRDVSIGPATSVTSSHVIDTFTAELGSFSALTSIEAVPTRLHFFTKYRLHDGRQEKKSWLGRQTHFSRSRSNQWRSRIFITV